MHLTKLRPSDRNHFRAVAVQFPIVHDPKCDHRVLPRIRSFDSNRFDISEGISSHDGNY